MSMTPKQRAVLEALARCDGQPETPNGIGQMIPRHLVCLRPNRTSHNGKQMGDGSMIAPTLTSLRNQGLVRRAPRRGGLSGTAYVITTAGRDALTAKEAS